VDVKNDERETAVYAGTIRSSADAVPQFPPSSISPHAVVEGKDCIAVVDLVYV
jgi:hypothetical protein|tara:strand:- start:175 stop:333 length:159 start_codon:yes stop_codon:yes gene_type:complete